MSTQGNQTPKPEFPFPTFPKGWRFRGFKTFRGMEAQGCEVVLQKQIGKGWQDVALLLDRGDGGSCSVQFYSCAGRPIYAEFEQEKVGQVRDWYAYLWGFKPEYCEHMFEIWLLGAAELANEFKKGYFAALPARDPSSLLMLKTGRRKTRSGEVSKAEAEEMAGCELYTAEEFMSGAEWTPDAFCRQEPATPFAS